MTSFVRDVPCARSLPHPCLCAAFINGVVSEMRDIGVGQCLKCSAVSWYTGGTCSWLVWLGLFLWQHTHEIITTIRTVQRKTCACHGYGRRLSLVPWLSFSLFPLLLLFSLSPVFSVAAMTVLLPRNTGSHHLVWHCLWVFFLFCFVVFYWCIVLERFALPWPFR